METQNQLSRTMYKFDLFKGVTDELGKVQKIKSIGHAVVNENSSTFTLSIKTFTRDLFFMMPERNVPDGSEYVVFTREPSLMLNKKYFWHNVGRAFMMAEPNKSLMKIELDLFSNEQIYFNTIPFKTFKVKSEIEEQKAA